MKAAVRLVVFALALAILTAWSAIFARADLLTIAFTGTISPWQWNGYNFVTAPTIDYDGSFGPMGASLTGDPFTVVWQVNTDCPLCSHDWPSSGYIVGGSMFGGGLPLTSATLNINDHSVDFATGGYLDAAVSDYNGYISVSVTVALIGPFNNLPIQMGTFISSKTSTAFPPNFQPFSYTFNPQTDNLDTAHQLGGAFYLEGDTQNRVYFNIDTVTLSVPGPIIGAGLPGLLALLSLPLLWQRRIAEWWNRRSTWHRQ